MEEKAREKPGLLPHLGSSLTSAPPTPGLLPHLGSSHTLAPPTPRTSDQSRREVPSLIVYGDQDAQLGERSLSNLSNLANHSVVVMKGAGHPCYLDDPDTWHKAVIDFLNTL